MRSGSRFHGDNGNPVYPLGPKYWGGSVDALNYITAGYNWGVKDIGDFYNIDENGNVLHEAETDYVYQKINFVRQLLAEDLINPEFFTMDATRAEEVSETKNSAIIADVHNYEEIIYGSEDWVPLGPLNDRTGSNAEVVPASPAAAAGPSLPRPRTPRRSSLLRLAVHQGRPDDRAVRRRGPLL